MDDSIRLQSMPLSAERVFSVAAKKTSRLSLRRCADRSTHSSVEVTSCQLVRRHTAKLAGLC